MAGPEKYITADTEAVVKSVHTGTSRIASEVEDMRFSFESRFDKMEGQICAIVDTLKYLADKAEDILGMTDLITDDEIEDAIDEEMHRLGLDSVEDDDDATF